MAVDATIAGCVGGHGGPPPFGAVDTPPDDPLKAKLVELRYFDGLTNHDAAEIPRISPPTEIFCPRSRANCGIHMRG